MKEQHIVAAILAAGMIAREKECPVDPDHAVRLWRSVVHEIDRLTCRSAPHGEASASDIAAE